MKKFVAVLLFCIVILLLINFMFDEKVNIVTIGSVSSTFQGCVTAEMPINMPIVFDMPLTYETYLSQDDWNAFSSKEKEE